MEDLHEGEAELTGGGGEDGVDVDGDGEEDDEDYKAEGSVQ